MDVRKLEVQISFSTLWCTTNFWWTVLKCDENIPDTDLPWDAPGDRFSLILLDCIWL